MLFVRERTPPPNWVHALASVSRPADRLSHVELWWEAGEPWGPVQRWVIYELSPTWTLSADHHGLMALEYPCCCARQWVRLTADDESTAERQEMVSQDVVFCPKCGGRRSVAFRRIYDTYHKRGYFARPFWIIQGGSGGHKVQYTEDESTIAAAMGLGRRPPTPGSLPYADFDRRVSGHVAAYDLAAARLASLRGARGLEKAKLAREARAAQEQYLTGAFAALEDMRLPLDEIPRVKQVYHDEPQAVARYIETGIV